MVGYLFIKRLYFFFSSQGGSSFTLDLKKMIPSSSKINAQQKCFADLKVLGAKRLVHIRDPKSHAFSQFSMCRDTTWGKSQTLKSKKKFPSTKNVTSDYINFLIQFAELNDNQVGPAYDFNCEDPRDVITRHMSCSKSTNILSQFVHPANHALLPSPNVSTAIQNIHSADMVGVTDFMREFLCMLRYYLQGKLPSGCICDDPQAENIFQVSHMTYGTKSRDIKFETRIELALVKQITKLDRMTFLNGALRSLCDMRVFEQSLLHIENRHILCDKKVKNFEKKIEYLLTV